MTIPSTLFQGTYRGRNYCDSGDGMDFYCCLEKDL